MARCLPVPILARLPFQTPEYGDGCWLAGGGKVAGRRHVTDDEPAARSSGRLLSSAAHCRELSVRPRAAKSALMARCLGLLSALL